MTYIIIATMLATMLAVIGFVTFPILQKNAINKAIKKRRLIADLKAGRNNRNN